MTFTALQGNVEFDGNRLCRMEIIASKTPPKWRVPQLRIECNLNGVCSYHSTPFVRWSSSPVPLKIRRVGQRCTLNLSRAETSSRWCGLAVRRGVSARGVVHVTWTWLKITWSVAGSLVLLNCATLIFNQSITAEWSVHAHLSATPRWSDSSLETPWREDVVLSCGMHHRTGPAPYIMVWGGIGYHSSTPLVRIAGILKSQCYISEGNGVSVSFLTFGAWPQPYFNIIMCDHTWHAFSNVLRQSPD
ncbi:uncharacterized protein TNCV_2255151 [Trichonephila clavipes]|nr:uncharacterized protein TNCV_2255151 [Trichonephila clavipes]